jgi:hypothetical protein
MTTITNPKLKQEILDLFKEQNTTKTPNIFGSEVIDFNLQAELLEMQKDQEEKSFLTGVGESITDFFSGTKRTEFSEVSEIGEYKGEGAAKVALGLSITPNQKSQLDIILSQVPGSNAMEDKFGNLIVVMPDGKSFYLNKPGASFQDFAQTTAQILQYIPGYSTIAKKYANNLLKRAVAQTGQATAVTAAQEAGAVALGGNFDEGRVGITGGITLAFEGAVGPLGKAVLKIFKGNPNYYKLVTETAPDGKKIKKIQVTKDGYKALDAAGIDINKMSPDFMEKYFNNLAKGLDDEVASVSAGTAKEFGFELSASQAKRNEEGIAALYKAANGEYGKEAQKKAKDFLSKQEINIGIGLKALVNKFNKGDITEESIEDLGQNLINAIEREAKKASDKVESAYNLIDKDAIFNGDASNIQILLNSVKKTVKDESKQPFGFLKAVDRSTGILDKDLTPAALKSFNEIKKFVNSFKKKKTSKKIPPKTLNDFESMRKKLNGYINAAKNDTDKKTAIAIKTEFDKLYDDTLDNLLFAGKDGDEILKQNIKNARKIFREKEQVFGVNVIKKGPVKINDPAGQAIQKILIDPEVTGMKAINYIYGTGTVGRSNTGVQIINRLKKVFNVENLSPEIAARKSKDFATLRSGMIEKMFNDSIRNGKFNPTSLVKNFDYIFNKNPDFAKVLFSPKEINTLKRFVVDVRKTLKPNDLASMSSTAEGVGRIFQRGARQLVGIIGFKLASIQGLLLGRSAFDNAKDVFEQRAAKKLISLEFGEKPGWLKTMNETTGTGRKLATTVGVVNQIMGQTVAPMAVDAPRTSKQFIEDIKPPETNLGGFRIPGVGTIGDQSSLPPTPGISEALLARASARPTGITASGLTPSEQALLRPEEQAIRLRQRGMA